MRRKLFLFVLLLSWSAVYSQRNICTEQFVTYPEEQNIFSVGEDYTLRCEPTGGRNVVWHKGTSSLSINPRPCGSCTVGEGIQSIELYFRDFVASDAGNYSCQIPVPGNDPICPFVITVPENPSVTIADNSSSVMEAERVTITPQISRGIPAGSFQWLFNGSQIESSDARFIDQSTGVLTIDNVQRSDRGRYTIRVNNTHATVMANYDLTVYFLGRPVVTRVTQDDDRVQLRCSVSGKWQGDLSFSWSPAPAGTGGQTPLEMIDAFTTRVNQTADIAVGNCANYTCTVMVRSNGAMSTSVPFPQCSGPRVIHFSNTAVTVEWNVMGSTTYRIQYGIRGDSNKLETGPLTSGSVLIEGLQAGMEYEFQLGMVQGSSTMYPSGSSTAFTLVRCALGTTSPSSPVTNVQANLITTAAGRTVELTWSRSTESDVAGYRVNVNTKPYQSHIMTEPRFLLDSKYCNGETYSYTVEAVNICNLASNSVTVTQKCSNIGGAMISFSVSSIGETTLTFKITVNSTQVNNDVSVKILASNLLPINGVRETRNYAVSFIDTVCLGDLVKNTAYNICLCTDFVSGIKNDNEKICVQSMTSDSQSDPSDITSCLAATGVSTEKVESPAGLVFPDWAIAVIVVGILAMVALVFCCIGVYYACSSNKSKEYIYGSTPSLQASSVNMPHNMHNPHRSTSPPRSCLSYHVKGHSTNWNEHSDTLRQMETDKGTHV